MFTWNMNEQNFMDCPKLFALSYLNPTVAVYTINHVESPYFNGILSQKDRDIIGCQGRLQVKFIYKHHSRL